MKIYQVAPPEMVQGLSQQGWDLEKVMDGDRIVTEHESVRDSNGYYQQIQKKQTLKSQTFLFSRETEGLGVQVEILTGELNQAKSDLRAFKEVSEHKLKKLTEESEKVKAELVQSNDSLYATKTKRSELEASYRKMELDLGKVRAAVGEIRMKEILETK